MNLGITPVNPQYQNFNQQSMMQTDPRMQNIVREHTAAGVREKSLNRIKDCETCKNRTYQDKSSDGGVSMQSPTRLSPEQAGSAVRAHEREHASREAARAQEEGREVISNDIRIFTAICPECGKTYVSGGETRTVTAKHKDEQQGALSQPEKLLDILI